MCNIPTSVKVSDNDYKLIVVLTLAFTIILAYISSAEVSLLYFYIIPMSFLLTFHDQILLENHF